MTLLIKHYVPNELTTNFSPELHPVLQRIYAHRGISADHEIDYALTHLLPFETLKNITLATECLSNALMQQKRILIIGDFDADGATSSAVAIRALRLCGAQHINYLVPNRFEFGYGLTPEIVAVAARWKPDLIITVDNGISSIDGVNAANALGIQVLITDHHLPGEQLPAAQAIVNPNQQGCLFPSKNLAGVGVIFYVMLALRRHLQEKNWFTEHHIPTPNFGQLLDLVALGTVADVVPLDHNNRILVHQGLLRIQANKSCPGIRALLDITGRNARTLVTTDLGFVLGPRLNAAGRLDDMSLGIACLLTDDYIEARQMAKQLDELNKERRAIQWEMQQEANQILAQQQTQLHQQIPAGICLFEEHWHQGVIGILAGRIKEHWHRPVIAFAPGTNNELKGSARSVPNLHIRDILSNIATQYPDLIDKFGGHAMAAGLTIQRSAFETFKSIFAQEVNRHLSSEQLQGIIYSDGELPSTILNINFAQLLRIASPWGQNFPEPIFEGHFDIIAQNMIADKHLKWVLRPSDSTDIHHKIDAIAFNIEKEQVLDLSMQTNQLHLVYRLDINEFRGLQRLQLIVQHFSFE